MTDLSITTSSGRTFDFEIQVVADLDVLRAQLRQMYPDASLKLAQIRTKLVVEGQARDAAQVARIIATIDAYMRTIQTIQIYGQVGDVRNVIQPGRTRELPARRRRLAWTDRIAAGPGARRALPPGYSPATGPVNAPTSSAGRSRRHAIRPTSSRRTSSR